MIFGNPGIYLDGEYGGFAIQVDQICNSEFYSVNLCVDGKIFPECLAINSKEYICAGLDCESKLFYQESEYLFNLPNFDLMVELIKIHYPYVYEFESLILNNKIDLYRLEKTKDESFIYDLIPELDDKERDDLFYWDIDSTEYKYNHVFVVNYNGMSKIAVISILKGSRSDGERFFDYAGKLKPNIGFFDNESWEISTSKIKTEELRHIVKLSYDYINQE